MIYKIDKSKILEEFENPVETLSQAGNEMEDDAIHKVINNAGKIAAGAGVLGAGAMALKSSDVSATKNRASDTSARMKAASGPTRVKGSTTTFSR